MPLDTKKTIVIGETMTDLNRVAGELGFNLKNATLKPSRKARREYRSLAKKYGGGDNIPEDVLRNSKGFQENKRWIEEAVDNG